MKGTLVLLAGMVFGLSRGPCGASFITLRVESEVESAGSTPQVLIRITNQGDEPARAVQVRARLEDFLTLTQVVQTLPVGETRAVVMSLGKVPTPPGVYPVIATVHYTDANGYPFSALSVLPLDTDEPSAPPIVSADLPPVTLTERGSTSLALRTTGEGNVDVRVRLIVPDEIRCETPDMNLVVFPGEARRVQVRFANVAARPGSAYPVFAVTEYEQGGRHHTAISHGAVSVEGAARPFSSHTWIWLAIIGMLLAVFVLIQFTQRVRGNPC